MPSLYRLSSSSPKYNPLPLYLLNVSWIKPLFFIFTATSLAQPMIISHPQCCKSFVAGIPSPTPALDNPFSTLPHVIFSNFIWSCHPPLRTLQHPIGLRLGTKFLGSCSGACMGWGLLGSLSFTCTTFPLLLLYFNPGCCPLFLEHFLHLPSHRYSHLRFQPKQQSSQLASRPPPH